MILTAKHPNAYQAEIWDENGNNLCKKYFIKWYNTETQTAGVFETFIDTNGKTRVKSDGLGGLALDIIHLPGSKLVFAEPLNKPK